MMSNSLLFSMLLKMDAGQAKAEMASFTAAVNKAGNEGAALASKLPAVTQNTAALGRANHQAAGSVGNLVANFNDLGVMIAAGQNSLQLAIQQGTQISQVIGPMGAAGAMRALGSAFVGMLNPINLVNFAVLAGGAAFVQWAMSGEEAASTVEDKFKDVEAAIVDVKDKIATISFGETNVSVARLLGDMDGISAKIEVINQKWRETDSLGQRQRYAEEANLLKAQYAEIEKVVQAYRDAVAEKKRLEDRSTAADMLADLQAEADLNAVIAQFGAQSIEATTMRAEQERAAYVEKVNSLNVIDAMRLALLAAYDEAQALAGVDFVSGIGAGADEAARLGGNLAEAANAWLAARSAAQDPARLAMGKYGSRGTVSSRPIEGGDGEAIRFLSSSRAASSGSVAKQADSVAKLIEKLQAELDITRELDPVQQEMARYRDQLAKATDAEIDKVRELIRLREEEKQKTEQLEYIQDQTGNSLIDGLMGAADAGERLIDTLMRAALQAIILGEGPLAKMFGGGTGLIAPLFSLIGGGAAGIGKADGGMIYGAGGPRDDAVPIWGSAGEFVVNARATQRHRALLEQINSGQLSAAPAFANGGAIGGNAGIGAAGGQVVLNINLDLRGVQGDDAVKSSAMKGVREALREYDRSTLPSSVRRVLNDPSVARF